LDSDYHIPVLCNTAVQFLINPDLKHPLIIDCTTGGGGYSEEICKKIGNDGKLICLDKDENALRYSTERLKTYSGQVSFTQGNFAEIDKLIGEEDLNRITGIVLDLGLSSYQLTDENGFSFSRNTPLDMRADSRDKLSAQDIINSYSKDELTEIFLKYGEIGNSGRLAEAIIRERRNKTISSTFDLVAAVNSEYRIKKHMMNSFLAKIFQAIRIEVNQELENLELILGKSVDLLVEGGRIVVISYHSLEDRIVKYYFKNNSGTYFKVLTKKAVSPDWTERKSNSKSRSAKLRAGERI